MTSNDAEIMGLKMLGWLASQEEAMPRFAALSGLDPVDLLAHASDPTMLGGMMDFVLSDEPLLLAFCEENDIHPESPAQARQLLPGGDIPHWT